MTLAISNVGELYTTTRKNLNENSVHTNTESESLFANNEEEEKTFFDKGLDLVLKNPIKTIGGLGIVGSTIALLSNIKSHKLRTPAIALATSLATLFAGSKLEGKKQTEKVEQEEVDTQQDNTQYTTHNVQPQETLYSLSKRYNTTVENLKELNDLTDNTIKVGQQLKVPYVDEPTEVSAKQTKTTTKNLTTHTVQPKETLFKLSKEYNTTVEELKKLNNLTDNHIEIGSTIKVPNTRAKVTHHKTQKHTVEKKETLYNIASRYDITVEELKAANNLKNNDIKIGQELNIPTK